MIASTPLPTVLSGDLDKETFQKVSSAEVIAWDIETTGLDWSTERIATVQLFWGQDQCALVSVSNSTPNYLKRLLEAPQIRKVFHHAMFDLRFMAFRWNAAPTAIACTKIASKILAAGAPRDHSLAGLVLSEFGVVLEKNSRLSDWTAARLNERQVAYAVNDVRFLVPLLEKLWERLQEHGRADLCTHCFDHVPARVALDIGRYGDVFEY